MLVPVEIDGEQALALVSTGTAEVTLDSNSRKEPSWVSLRLAAHRCPGCPRDGRGSFGISRMMNVP